MVFTILLSHLFDYMTDFFKQTTNSLLSDTSLGLQSLDSAGFVGRAPYAFVELGCPIVRVPYCQVFSFEPEPCFPGLA